MSDVVYRQAAIDALDRIFDRCEEIEAHLPKGDPDITGYKMYPDYMIVWEYLHQLPSAEPEVIRCKDCKYQEKFFHTDGSVEGGGHYVYGCELTDGYSHVCLDDDFCSRAERRRP